LSGIVKCTNNVNIQFYFAYVCLLVYVIPDEGRALLFELKWVNAENSKSAFYEANVIKAWAMRRYTIILLLTYWWICSVDGDEVGAQD
jgi:hypothetical protein